MHRDAAAPDVSEHTVLQFLGSMFLAILVTLGRRLRGRRPWPSLSFKQEVVMELFERMSAGFSHKSFETLRADERSMVRPPSIEHPIQEETVSVPPLDLRGAWFRPKHHPRPERALIWMHGGAYVSGLDCSGTRPGAAHHGRWRVCELRH